MNRMDVVEHIQREEHALQMVILEQIHYFQSQLRERLFLVWRGQNLLSKKVEKLETWMEHFEGHVQCDFHPPPPPGIGSGLCL